MACMYGNNEYPSVNFGDSSLLTNCIFDSGSTCHMTPEVSDFTPGSLEDTDKNIEVTLGHHFTAKQKGQVRIKMCNDNGYRFIVMLHNVLLAADLCDRLFSIIKLINSGHTCLFQIGFCTGDFLSNEKNAVTLPHGAQRKHAFWGEIKEMSKTNKFPSRKKIALELFHQRLGHRSTRSLLDGYTATIWEDIYFRIYPNFFAHYVKFLQ